MAIALARQPSRLHPGVAVLGGLLLCIVVVQLGWSLGVIILQPGEAIYGEASVYDHAARILRGEALYQPLDRPPYTVAAYTPLYYWLVAGLQVLVGPGFGPGRGLSFVAGLAAAGLVAYLTARRLRDQWAGAFAALLFLALGLPWLYVWSALYRVDLLGVALSLGAVATLVGGTTLRRLILAGMLAGLAVLTKQTLLAGGIAGVVWLWRRDRKNAAVFAGTGLAITLGTCLILEVTTGAFLANTVMANVNPFNLDVLVSNLLILGLFQAGPLVVAALYVRERARVWQRPEDELLVWYWLASMLPLMGLGKVGSAQNYWIELAAATAVLATLVTWSRLGRHAMRMYQDRPPIVPIILLGVTLAALTPVAAATALPTSGQFSASLSGAEAVGGLIERVRSEPGEVLAEPLDIVVLAGRPILFEPTIFGILQADDRWDAGPLTRRICAGEVGLLVLGEPLQSVSAGRYRYAHWPAPILEALRQTMVLESEQAGRFLYVPREDAPSQGCAALVLMQKQTPPAVALADDEEWQPLYEGRVERLFAGRPW